MSHHSIKMLGLCNVSAYFLRRRKAKGYNVVFIEPHTQKLSQHNGIFCTTNKHMFEEEIPSLRQYTHNVTDFKCEKTTSLGKINRYHFST